MKAYKRKASWFAMWAVVMSASGVLLAQESNTTAGEVQTTVSKEEASNIFELGTISVQGEAVTTAEKIEVSVDQEQIEKFEKKDVGKALSRLPGVLYTRASGSRYESGVKVRGFSSGSSVPIYIDGVPAYVPYDGFMDMGRFTTADVSSIRVAKGYSSVLYGPNTLGGVINIITQRPTKALDGHATVGIGSGRSSEGVLSLGTLQDMWYAQANVSYYERKHITAAKKFTGDDAQGNYRDTDKENYRTRDKKGSVKLGFIPNATDEYVLSYLKQEGVKGIRDGADGYTETTWEWPVWDRETISFVSHTQFGNAFYIKPRAYYDQLDNALYNWGNRGYTGWYDDYAYGASLEAGTEAIKNNILRANVQYKFDQHKGFDTYGRTRDRIPDTDQKMEQKIISFAVEDTYQFTSQWEAQAGISYSKRKTETVGLGSNLNGLLENFPEVNGMLTPDIDTWDPQAAVFYKPTENHTFHYSIAKKTLYPTMRQQFSNYGAGNSVTCTSAYVCPPGADPDTNYPLVSLQNPGLKPERALHHEIGYEGTPLPRLFVQTSLFYSRNKNKINRGDRDYITYPGFAVQQTINIDGDVERKGLDLGIEYDLTHNIALGLSYSYIKTKDKDNKEYYFTDEPKHHGAIYGDIRFGEWLTIIPAMDFYSDNYDDTKGINKNPGYAITDLKFSVTPPAWKGLSFNFGVENVFDKDYREYGVNYPTPGRYYYANIRYDL